MVVTVYTSPGCPWCSKVKDFLKKENISFKEIDISADKKVADDLVKRSGFSGVPITEVGKVMILGFDEKKLLAALEKNG